jgi:NAD(P)-dependent dehydrogenase (short-subunit alcohol dehydrogenase family)
MGVLELFDLRGHVALVTGGARGLGYQHALALAEAGADVAIGDLLEEEVEAAARRIREATRRRALCMRLDVTDATSIEGFIQRATSELGEITLLVNNAARPSEGCLLEMVSDDLWRSIIDINLSSLFYVGKRVAAVMSSQGRGGCIINIASINAQVISNIAPRYNAAYCTSKAGVAQLTKGMAAQWASSGIRVNALAPGYILTEQTAASARNPEIYARNLANTPMGRYGGIDELKGAIVFLASQASSFMTGSLLTIDGGYTIW